jgi:hypothetical protein
MFWIGVIVGFIAFPVIFGVVFLGIAMEDRPMPDDWPRLPPRKVLSGVNE